MKTLVIIPTYNEKENLPILIKKILDLKLDLQILVVDDNSPDGTGKVADELAKNHPEVSVLHRRTKMGLGSAYFEGFKWALGQNFDFIITMDADLSHNPKDILRFLEEAKDFIFNMVKRKDSVDVMILDPPREGSNPKIIKGISLIRPKKIIYVSCNPATMTRDIAMLQKFYFKVNSVQPIDLFPHTPHIECVAEL